MINSILSKNRYNLVILSFFLLIVTALIIYYNFLKVYDFFTNQEVESVKWPFQNLQDENNKNLPIIAIKGYIDSDKSRDNFKKLLNKNYKFIGLSSNNSHPRISDNPYGSSHIQKNIQYNNKNIEDYVYGWCHCFREPHKYIKNNIPIRLISNSDFINIDYIKPKNNKKIYHFIAIQPKDNNQCKEGWIAFYKNWKLCKNIVKILVDDLNLVGVIVGRKGCENELNIKNKKNLILTDKLKHTKLLDYISKSKFTLLPNLEEASPRVLAESLCLDVPVLVYENILGGWKYVNNKTGQFFNEDNIKEKVKIILNNKYTPREYYISNYGRVNSGYRLKKFMKELFPNMIEIDKSKYIKFSSSW